MLPLDFQVPTYVRKNNALNHDGSDKSNICCHCILSNIYIFWSIDWLFRVIFLSSSWFEVQICLHSSLYSSTYIVWLYFAVFSLVAASPIITYLHHFASLFKQCFTTSLWCVMRWHRRWFCFKNHETLWNKRSLFVIYWFSKKTRN